MFLPVLVAIFAPQIGQIPTARTPRAYLVAAGKPTLEVEVPRSPVAKTAAVPTERTPFPLKVAPSDSLVDWIVSLNAESTFESALVNFDAEGRIRSSVPFGKSTVTSLAFPPLRPTSSGAGGVTLLIRPAAKVEKSFSAVQMQKPSPPALMRFSGYDLTINGKPVAWQKQLMALTVTSTGQQFEGTAVFQSDITGPNGLGPAGPAVLTLKLSGLKSRELRIVAGRATTSASRVGQATMQMHGVRFEKR